MRDQTHSSTDDDFSPRAGQGGPPKSSAIFRRSRPGDVHIRQDHFRREHLLTNACIGCGVSHDVKPRLFSRVTAPEWYIIGAAGIWGAFLVLAAQAPDFLWYHSTQAQDLYAFLAAVCVNWTITLPFVFLAAVGVGSLFFVRSPWISLCGSCNTTQRQQTRRLRGTIAVGSIVVVLASYLLLATFKLPLVLASVVVLPFALGAIYLARHQNAATRMSVHPPTEGVFTVHGGPALRDVLTKEVPGALAPAPSGRRWAAAAVSALVFGAAFALVTHATDGQLSCPPDARMMDRTVDGKTQQWCEATTGVAHGRYVQTDADGKLEVIGGFHRGTPTGLWLDYRGQRSVTVDEFDVANQISTYAPGFDGVTFAR